MLRSLLLAAGAFAEQWPELLPYNPVAPKSQQVVVGDARFTVLSPQLLRLEYKTGAQFEDRATTAFLHRAGAAGNFTKQVSSDVLTLETEALRLVYHLDQPFSSSSLSVESLDKQSAFKGWSFGQKDPENLLGTIKSLDMVGPISLNCDKIKHKKVHKEDLHCAWGLVSRSGWAVADDSDTWVMDPSSGWWQEENRNEVDIYLFAHGHNFKAALRDFVSVAGKPALPPRAATGVWWTRWYNLNSADVKEVVEDYASRSLPLDVFVLDMDWHSKQAWGGYSWDRRIIPKPKKLMKEYLQQHQGLLTLVNVHDDNGVASYEDKHNEVAQAMGLDPDTCGDIPFQFCANQTYVQALEDIVVKGLYDDGVDHLWIDWQQGGEQGGCQGMKQNPTIWTNKVRCTNPQRWGLDKRGMVLARWGGLGSHRYPVGFSGDVLTIGIDHGKFTGLTWKDLAYQPYFSATAANVAYGLWSHDITAPAGDFELLSRWLQFGAYSGVLRSHDRGQSAGVCNYGLIKDFYGCSIVRPWNVPTPYFEANRGALRARAALVPYIYSMLKRAYDTGLSLMRPMYYEHPELEFAYKTAPDGSFAQYYFGDDMIAAPVVNTAHSRDGWGLADKELWVPPGTWVEQDTGAVRVGHETATWQGRFPIGEVPVLVRAGAVIPRRSVPTGGNGRTVGLAAQAYDALEFSVYPGRSRGEMRLYEDDGSSTGYLKEESAEVIAAYQFDTDLGILTFNLSTTGTFPGQPQHRAVTLRIINAPPAAKVSRDGQELGFASYGGYDTWRYDGPEAALVVDAGVLPTAAAATFVIEFPAQLKNMWQDGTLAGIKGAVAHANLAKQALDEMRLTPGASTVDGGELAKLSVLGEELSDTADDLQAWQAFATGAPQQLAAALAELKAMPIKNELLIGPLRNKFAKELLEESVAALPEHSRLLV